MGEPHRTSKHPIAVPLDEAVEVCECDGGGVQHCGEREPPLPENVRLFLDFLIQKALDE